MSVPLVCYCMAAPRPLVQLLNLLHRLRLLLSEAFFYVGLCRGAAADSAPIMSHHAPTSATLRSPETPSRIKAQLPVVEYGSLAPARHLAGGGEEQEEEHDCAFCMEAMEARDQVRVLGNCRHAFHKGCMDRWVDSGRVSCPVCRSDLLPQDESKCALKSLGHLLVRRHNLGPPRPVTRT